MKLWKKILLIAVIILVLSYIAAYLIFVFKGRAIIISQLEDLTQKKVNIGYFGLTPPLNLEIKNLEIKDLAKINSLSFSPSILGLLTGKLALNYVTIIKPEFTYEIVAPLSATAATTPIVSAPAAAVKAQEKRALRLAVKRIKIKDGRLDLIDRTVGQDGIKIIVKDINFSLTNLYTVPRSVITDFELKGTIPWQEGQEEGKIEAEGWINLFKKDIQATLRIKDIDGIYLYPYYSNWVDLEKARIEKAKLNFTSNIQGLNNDITAQCRLELTDIVRKPRLPEEAAEKAEKITDAVLGIFRALNQGNIVLDFTFKTKMDRPQFGFGDIRMAFEDKLLQATRGGKSAIEEVLLFPAKLLQTTVKNATDISKALVDGTVAVGKAVLEPFKKEKKE